MYIRDFEIGDVVKFGCGCQGHILEHVTTFGVGTQTIVKRNLICSSHAISDTRPNFKVNGFMKVDFVLDDVVEEPKKLTLKGNVKLF